MHRKNTVSDSGFTIMELLITIAIIAILAVLVLVVINPAELLSEARDVRRVSDLQTLNHAITLYIGDQSRNANFSLGTASTTYISIPDPSATTTSGDQCQGVGLLSLGTSSGNVYNCSAPSIFRNASGTGWLPVNFTRLSTGMPFSSGGLSVDPTNASSSGLFYTYSTDGGLNYELTAVLESQKYRNQLESSTLISPYPGLDIQGTSLALSALYNPQGLVGYWSFNEGAGSTVIDSSGSGANGTWIGANAGTNGHYSAGKVGNWAGYFDGITNYVNAGTPAPLNITNAITISVWIKQNCPLTGNGSTCVIVSKGPYAGGNGDYLLRMDTNNHYLFGLYQGSWTFPTSASTVTPNVWHNLIATWDGSTMRMYQDGVPDANTTAFSGTLSANTYPVTLGQTSDQAGSQWFTGSIDDVRIYNRALSPAEIAGIYNTGK